MVPARRYAMAGFAFVFFVGEFLRPIAGQVGTAICGSLLAFAFAWMGVALWQDASLGAP